MEEGTTRKRQFDDTIALAERTLILGTVKEAGGDTRKAARALGIKHEALLGRLRRYRNES